MRYKHENCFYMGAPLFAKYCDVVNREELLKACHLRKEERNELLDILFGVCRWRDIDFGWRPNLKDEGDNHLIELAVAGRANCIVSINIKDLTKGELLFPNIRLLTP